MPRSMASVGSCDVDDLAIEQDLALIGPGQAVEDVHERGLAGAVLAQQGVDLARLDVEVDAVVGHDARVALGDAAHLQRGRGDARGLLARGWVRHVGLDSLLTILRPPSCLKSSGPTNRSARSSFSLELIALSD